MPSTGHGLIYPDSSGSANLWEHYENLAVSTEAAFDAYETWTSWTPAFDTASGGGFTSVGSGGTNQGFYQRIGTGTGALVHAEFRIQLASGFAVDTGNFILILPIGAYQWGGTGIQATLGNWTARNDSDPFHYAGSLGLWASGATSVTFNGSWDGAQPRSRIDSNDPIAWGSGDVLSGVLNYRAA